MGLRLFSKLSYILRIYLLEEDMIKKRMIDFWRFEYEEVMSGFWKKVCIIFNEPVCLTGIVCKTMQKHREPAVSLLPQVFIR